MTSNQPISNKRILIVDDEPNIVLSLEFLMQQAGHTVYTATDGEMALRLLARFEPHLLLLDIALPMADGFSVCRQIRAQPRWDGLKIVMLTARSQTAEIKHGLQLGADAYITKPFSTVNLVAEVSRLLEDAPAAAQGSQHE